MEVIIQFFTNIADFFLGIWNVLSYFVEEIITFAKLFANIPPAVIGSLIWLPESVIGVCGCLIAIVIVYKILGREG